MKDKELFPDDDQAGWLPPDVSKIDEKWPLKIIWEENKPTTNEQQQSH